jgi:hypothetical protein
MLRSGTITSRPFLVPIHRFTGMSSKALRVILAPCSSTTAAWLSLPLPGQKSEFCRLARLEQEGGLLGCLSVDLAVRDADDLFAEGGAIALEHFLQLGRKVDVGICK